MVIGSSIMPASERLTMSTWCAWSSMDRLRWITPRPPWRAMATAIRASVTVSIGEEISGTFTEIRFDTGVLVSTSDGMMSLWFGCSSTSSNVRPSVANGCGTPAGVRSPMVCDTCSLSCLYGSPVSRLRPGYRSKTIRNQQLDPPRPQDASGPLTSRRQPGSDRAHPTAGRDVSAPTGQPVSSPRRRSSGSIRGGRPRNASK